MTIRFHCRSTSIHELCLCIASYIFIINLSYGNLDQNCVSAVCYKLLCRTKDHGHYQYVNIYVLYVCTATICKL